MKILWITNILFPEASFKLTGIGELKSSGGWMLGMANELINLPGVELSVATVSDLVSDLKVVQGTKITYYVLPLGKGNQKPNSDYEPFWKRVRDLAHPDVVHIHGSEYSHGLAYVNVCGVENVVVSIQGMTSAYYYYYYYGLTNWEILRNITVYDILRQDSLFDRKRNFKKRSIYEIDLLKKVKHIIGRTSWDRAHTWAINSDAQYHFNNETLRNEFYDGVWEYNKCNKHTIFLSQAQTSIKGLHQILRAMPLILEHFPDTVVKVGGGLVINDSRIRITGLGNILQKLIHRNHLEKHIVFTGNLNADQMKQAMLSANLFLCPSTIENSPNSLGEAQLLGVPCLASYVGGIMDMIPNEQCGQMYRFEEIEMLAYKVCEIFNSSASFDNKIMRETARIRHDAVNNAQTLWKIYNSTILTFLSK